MCTFNNEIKFCTCVEEDIYEIKDIYIWSLNRYVGKRETNRRGKIMIPVNDFENGISTESIILKLNTGNIFDFEYIPEERDTLYISFNAKNNEEYKYFKLIFRDKCWQEGSNPAFVSINKNIAKGEIIIEKQTP
ncbi:hypothetical protein HNP38_000206 [Chryseobacterium defluvii]|uniref:Uncharacterized protein n=1 Tax=Chryseobacterium defluvii TaxID=160396 RepID=A0A840KAT3_9FLAO|nr:hypothetical protein [Chryseobacterium defluvii]MBB4804934.1 hypothetical protein [Chryseobacterium defluvii]